MSTTINTRNVLAIIQKIAATDEMFGEEFEAQYESLLVATDLSNENFSFGKGIMNVLSSKQQKTAIVTLREKNRDLIVTFLPIESVEKIQKTIARF